jgi:hypothetical protein
MSMVSSHRISPGMRFFVTRVFPWPFIIVGALVACFGARSVYRAKESMTWPSAEGNIRSSSVAYHSGDDGGGTYHAEILYTFTVDGQTHSGNKVAFGDYGSSNPSHAQTIVNRYPKGTIVQVRYSPDDPDVCVLEPGLKAQAWAIPAFGLGFFTTGMLMAIFLPKLMSKQETAEPTGATEPRDGASV